MSKQQLRIAIIGAGPAGLYATGHLLEQYDYNIEIDIFDRLPTPYGLVRSGVAPDHPEKKRVIDKMFDGFLKHSKVRFFGNIDIGTDLHHHELTQWYDAVIYSVGASSDTKMGISGEELSGSWAAREFVAWYNGHPDYSHLNFDLSHKRAVIVGNGNVALDVARILTLPLEELKKTDIADHAIDALAKSSVEEVVLLGRRSHFQGAFNNPELEELAHLTDVDIVIENDSLPLEQEALFKTLDWQSQRKVDTLKTLAARANLVSSKSNKRIILRFLSSPVALIGESKVSQVKMVRNVLTQDNNGTFKPTATNNETLLDTGLVLRAIGYRGKALSGVPFDESKGVIPNKNGRVTEDNQLLKGTYVTGWIKRGPKGVIGSNKKCARDTIRLLIEDIQAGNFSLNHSSPEEITRILRDRKPNLTDKNAWYNINQVEREQGQAQNRPSVKKTTWQTLLKAAIAQ